MWPIIARCRQIARVPSLLESFTNISRCTGSLFHVLAGIGSPPSPLANQCSNQLQLQTPTNGARALLRPLTNPMLSLACGFKVKGRLKRRCKDCYFVMRKERLYVICKTHPRHKQMSMKKHDRNTWILTDATQSPVRAW
ncbi:39S ribosomal protein L36, mitochondrial [Uranotaenia lowii]|uniref:39S ribosomal protein L36, mitochondrial n=1 Tax=Uranotaenia lowii TaxID=190385 RepID=UPI0024786D75|nr:39S ribosomal protein L36, mitochondrial [Uranotaenia lowii]